MRFFPLFFGIVAVFLLAGCTKGDTVVSSVTPNCSETSSDSYFKYQLETCEKTSLLLIQDRDEKIIERDDCLETYEELKKYVSSLFSTSLSSKNPTNSGAGYSYAACGINYKGDKTDCSYNVYCTGSMMPLFDCEEKLLFTNKKSGIAVGDIVDIRLDNPVIVKTYESGEIVITRMIHKVVGVNGDTYTTAGIRYVYTGSPSDADSLKITKDDIQGVLKGVVW